MSIILGAFTIATGTIGMDGRIQAYHLALEHHLHGRPPWRSWPAHDSDGGCPHLAVSPGPKPIDSRGYPPFKTNSSHLKIGLSKRKVVFQSSIFRGELLVSGSEEKRNLSWNQSKYCWFLTANVEAIPMKIREPLWNTSSTQHIWMHVNEPVTSVVVSRFGNLFVFFVFFSSPQNRGQTHRVLGISTAKTAKIMGECHHKITWNNWVVIENIPCVEAWIISFHSRFTSPRFIPLCSTGIWNLGWSRSLQNGIVTLPLQLPSGKLT